MATPNKQQMGNTAVAEVPKPTWKPISSKEAEKFDKYINKSYVPKDDADFAKKYFVRPIHTIKYVPADNAGGVNEFGLKFLCQKFHRNKMVQAQIADGKGGTLTVTDNEQVVGHIMNNDGFWECIDPTASFTMDVRDFAESYEQDNEN